MNPTQITQTLQSTLVNYLTTIFDVNRDGQEPELATAIRDSISQSGALFNGPYLELAPPYIIGSALRDLCRQGVLSNELTELPCFRAGRPIPLDASLYAHQEKAIRKISGDRRSVVVSSGTGSGKTECFLIPILNDLLLDPTPGVRALLVYPLNALVNDQIDRLRRLLVGTNITFGRYTSELANTEAEARSRMKDDPLPNEVISREQIRSGKALPQILITNYAMLEYLLLRPEDSILFQRGAWRFIVLDEAHTYTGAQGVEVAMLMRRLKHRLNKQKGEVRCIATSATLTDNDTLKASQFASDLFDEDFAVEDIILGEMDEQYVPETGGDFQPQPNAYHHEEFEQLLEELRNPEGMDTEKIALRLHQFGLIPDSLLSQADSSPGAFLYKAMLGNRDLTTLRNWMMRRRDNPAHLDEASEEMFPSFDPDARRHALYHLIELGSLARRQEDHPSLLPARYHLFARPPQGIWVCINPHCKGRTTSDSAGWSRIFSVRHETCDACGCKTYPVVVCRECGQVFLRVLEHERHYILPPDDFFTDGRIQYFTWKQIQENRALVNAADIEESANSPSEDKEEAKFRQEEKQICLKCGCLTTICSCTEAVPATLFHVHEIEISSKGTRKVPVDHLNQCPRCYSKSMTDTEIVTTVSVGGVTPLAILAYEVYRQLPKAQNLAIAAKPGEGRKLLTFYDNRQGAARFAAFLQDVVNTQNYRHVIVEAVRQFQAKYGYPPATDKLADTCVQIAWENRVFHNDPDGGVWRTTMRQMTRGQHDTLQVKIATRLLAEFTTNKDERQSLEKLGVIGVEYFEPDNLPDFAALGQQIDLPEDVSRSLLEYLLDDLRKKKCVVLPDGVLPNDTVFGRNVANPPVVKRASGNSRELSWIGKTPRQYRRQFVQTVLRQFGKPSEETAVISTLEAMWEWLRNDCDVFKHIGGGGYQIRHESIYFRDDLDWYRCSRCQRVYCHSDKLPCPYPSCGGKLEVYDVSERQQASYFFGTYQRQVIPMRVEEHTAQLSSEKGRSYQEGFRDGDINALSCSTTFEMGIDLGDLQAVVMNNVPPTVANYRQRAGRAGRRASGTAFILTWASERPHDQNYFRTPPEIIRGHIKVPFIALDNPYISQRHINAILLSAYLRYLSQAGHGDLGQVGAFFDPQTKDAQPYYLGVEKWLTFRQSEIETMLERFLPSIPLNTNVEKWIKDFQSKMADVNENFALVSQYYRQQYELAHQKSAQPGTAAAEARAEMDRYDKLLIRLQKEFLIEYLSSRGVLPSYSFPLYTVEMSLPFTVSDRDQLRLERDLRQAIREYAPGSEVVADKRIWRSGGLQFYRSTVRDREYRICPDCNHLEIAREAGFPIGDNKQCPICSGSFKKTLRYVTPDGFRADPSASGKFARQYVQVLPAKMRSALIPRVPSSEQQLGNIVRYAYERNGELLYVNEANGSGFRICYVCGSQLDPKQKRCKGRFQGAECPGTRIEMVALGHMQTTDTLHLRFEGRTDFSVPSPHDMSFWLSLMYALIQGASRTLQIERRDIDGVLVPRSISGTDWEQTIVLFDNVPGGAGHVRQIQTEFARVLQEAQRIVNCTDCAPETSCYHCLKDYNNQLYHTELRRGQVLRFLETLLRDFTPSPTNDLPGTGAVVAANLPDWLMRQVEQSQQAVYLAAESIESSNWLDILYDLQKRKIDVRLYLESLPPSRNEGLSTAQHLQLLIERGMKLYQVSQLPAWTVVVDPAEEGYQRAIRPHVNGNFTLNSTAGSSGLLTTIHPEGLKQAQEQFEALHGRLVQTRELNPPPNVRVMNIKPQPGYKVSERAFFEDVFERPVERIMVNDAYLIDHERIFHRLGAYLRLAAAGGALTSVNVITSKAGHAGKSGSWQAQQAAEEALNRELGGIITFKHANAEHDRYILLTRTDGTQTRILIGQGLDFIQPDGRVRSTYVVIEDPYKA